MFDKNDFVESVIERGLSRNEILSELREEIDLIESSSHRVKGALDTKALRSGEYVRFLGSVGFLLQSRKIPANRSDDDFQLLHRLAQHLVDHDGLNPDILELFGE